jgi:uncharacterized membrane protein YhaH (DUF805 family)
MAPGMWQILFSLLTLAVFVVPTWKIVAKAGFSGWWSLLMLVPFVNFIMLWMFAFMDWPAVRKGNPQPFSSPDAG